MNFGLIPQKCTVAKYLKPITLVCILILVGGSVFAQKDCDFQTAQNGIKVYTCKRDDSNLKAVRATFEVETTVDQYASIVLNVEAYKYWNYAATNPYVVNKINEQELIYYSEAKAPWPVTDRFVVLHLTVKKDPKTNYLMVTLNNVPDQIPEKAGFVRVQDYYSTLEVIPVSATKVKVLYYLEIDPGGAIPDWVVNMVSSKFPINTFSNLKERIKSQHEQKDNGSPFEQ